MARRVRHFYEAMGPGEPEGEKDASPARATPKPQKPAGAAPPGGAVGQTPVPLPGPSLKDVRAVENTVVLRRDTFFAGLLFVVVLIVVAFVVGRASVGRGESRRTSGPPEPTLQVGRYAVLVAEYGTLDEARRARRLVERLGWRSAKVLQAGARFRIVLGEYKRRSDAEEAAAKLRGVTVGESRPFADAKCYEER